MEFYELLEQVLDLLRRRGRVSYRALKVQFHLDDDYLAALKDELIDAQRFASDEDGKVLVWTGDTVPAPPARESEPAPLAYTPLYLTEKILASRLALEGERKQVTVLFADIKGSTELIQGLDPEQARSILDPVLHAMMDAVHRYEGTVNQVLGDGIMALFGAPIAHEDHAIRACYAALAMQTALRDYAEEVRHAHGLTIQSRIGLNSGEVVGRTIHNDLRMDYSAVGQTTHLAAWMEEAATPDTILLTAATVRLVEGLVRLKAWGSVPVKGLAEPMEVFELLGASGLRRRLQTARARGLTRFVGRQMELATLHAALARAGAGHGQVGAGGGGGGGREVAAGGRVCPGGPQPGLAGARQRRGVLRPGHALLPGPRPAAALLPPGGGRRRPHRAGQGDGAGVDARRCPPGHDPGAPRAARCPARGQPLPTARCPATPPAHVRRAQAGAAARESGATRAAGL